MPMLGSDSLMLGSAAAAGAPALPTFGLIHNWRSDLGITKDGSDLVSAWDDQVGSINFSQGTGTNQPLWVDAVVNGHPVIKFDGVDNFLNATFSPVVNQPYHIFMALYQATYSVNKKIFSQTPTEVAVEQRITSGYVSMNAGSAYGNSHNLGLTTWRMYHGFFNGASSYQGHDNAATTGPGSSGAATLKAGFQLCGNGVGGANGNIWFREIAVYSAEQTGTPLTEIKAHFESDMGLTF